MMNYLISLGAEVNLANGLGLTPLSVAVLNSNFQAAKVRYYAGDGRLCKPGNIGVCFIIANLA